MIKGIFMKAAHYITSTSDYIHSLEEPTKDLMKVVAESIANGTLQGVAMVRQSLFLQPKPAFVPIKIKND